VRPLGEEYRVVAKHLVRGALEHERREAVFGAIKREKPRGVRYASFHRPDRTIYLAMLELEDGVENRLFTIPEFVEFQNDLKSWTSAPPMAETFIVVSSYRLFDESNGH